MKYVDTRIVFQEVPDRITLAISISNCPNSCEGCHSSYLKEDIGEPLDANVLHKLIGDNNGINCVCFMGGDANPEYINELAYIIKETYPNLKVAWYSGKVDIDRNINLRFFDFIKTGPYIEERGPLTSKHTNQRMYKIIHLMGDDGLSEDFEDITYKFWRNETKN